MEIEFKTKQKNLGPGLAKFAHKFPKILSEYEYCCTMNSI